MTEKENIIPPEIQESLTSKPNPSKLGGEGDIFMSEGQKSEERSSFGEQEREKPKTAEETVDYLRRKAQDEGKERVKTDERASTFYDQLSSQGKAHVNLIAESLMPEKDKIFGLEGFSVGDYSVEQITDLENKWKMDKDNLKSLIAHSLLYPEEENRKRNSLAIYEEMVNRLNKEMSKGKKEFTDLLQHDVGWLGMILAVEKGIKEQKFEIAGDKKDEFLEKLDKAKELIRGIQTGKDLTDVKYEESMQLLREISGIENGEKPNIKEYVNKYENLTQETLIQSIEDLGRLIMDSEGEEWRTGGENKIIDKEGNFHPENFLAWVRSRIMWYHGQTPDGEINLFSEISVATVYRVISFGEMIGYAKYFMEREERLGTDINKGFLSDSYIHKDEYDNLKELALYEVWLFQMSHNYDVKYRATKGIEEKLPEALAEIYYNNVFTKNKNRLLKILMLSGNNAEELKNIIEIDKIENQTEQGSIGKAVRRTLLAYYYLSEIDYVPSSGEKNMFEEALGEERTSKFYKSIIGQIGNVDDLRLIARETDKKRIIKKAEEVMLREWKFDWEVLKDSNGRIVRDEEGRAKLNPRKVLNIFNHPKKPELVREVMKAALKHSIGLNQALYAKLKTADLALYEELCSDDFDEGGKRKKDRLDKKESEYAVEWASTMVEWTGIGARNDTEAIGFDAWSKIINAKEYRKRQSKGKSPAGDPLTIFGLKRLGLNFWEGIRVSKAGKNQFDRSILEVLQGGQGDEVGIDEDIELFEAEGNAERQFMADHITNAFNVYKFVMQEHGINFDKILKPGYAGMLERVKKEEDIVFKGIWKQLRYAYDLPDFLWSHAVRGWDRDSGGNIQFGSKKLEEAMFNNELLGLEMYEERFPGKGSKERALKKDAYEPKRDENGEIIRNIDGEPEDYDLRKRKQIARNVFAYLIAKDLYAHRKMVGGYRWYTSTDLSLIKTFFTKYNWGIKEGDDYDVDSVGYFFNDSEFNQIEKMGHSVYGNIFAKELGASSLGAFLISLTEGFKKFINATIKT